MSGPDLFGVANRAVLVVGGTRGIGRAISVQLARAGANVIVNYARSERSAQELEALAVAEGLRIATLRADVGLDQARERLATEVLGRATPLHAVVFAAATGVHRELGQVTARHFDFVFGLNVRAMLLLMQQLSPAMQAGASVVAISSEGAVRVMPYYGLVSASKAALEAACRQLAVELAPRGIRVNVVSPGAVRTDAWQALPDAEQRLARAEAATPRGALVSAEEVAATVQFLLSEASSGITGQTIVVDGGARIRGSG